MVVVIVTVAIVVVVVFDRATVARIVAGIGSVFVVVIVYALFVVAVLSCGHVVFGLLAVDVARCPPNRQWRNLVRFHMEEMSNRPMNLEHPVGSRWALAVVCSEGFRCAGECLTAN